MKTITELLMEIQDCDELLYTTTEAKLMLEYRDAVKRFLPNNDEEQEMCNKLIANFEELNILILEYVDRLFLSVHNVSEPTTTEINGIKKIFDRIESLDFESSEMYESLMGEMI